MSRVVMWLDPHVKSLTILRIFAEGEHDPDYVHFLNELETLWANVEGITIPLYYQNNLFDTEADELYVYSDLK